MGKGAGIGGVLGPLLGMFGQQQTNSANSQAQQQAFQQAMQMLQQQTGQDIGQQQGFNQNAMSQLMAYMQGHPNPASGWQNQGPQQFGGGRVMSPGGPGLMGGQQHGGNWQHGWPGGPGPTPQNPGRDPRFNQMPGGGMMQPGPIRAPGQMQPGPIQAGGPQMNNPIMQAPIPKMRPFQ